MGKKSRSRKQTKRRRKTQNRKRVRYNQHAGSLSSVVQDYILPLAVRFTGSIVMAQQAMVEYLRDMGYYIVPPTQQCSPDQYLQALQREPKQRLAFTKLLNDRLAADSNINVNQDILESIFKQMHR